jgi:drug/metabolite transporter (DMT)-like permease
MISSSNVKLQKVGSLASVINGCVSKSACGYFRRANRCPDQKARLGYQYYHHFILPVPILASDFIPLRIYLRGRDFLQINQRRILFFRSLLGLCGITFWFLSIRSMPLGMATALFQSSVIFITLLAPIFLGEKVGIYRWTAVIAGLAGVVIITDPFAGAMSWYALYGIGAALVGAGLSLMLRQLGKGDAPASVAAWYNLAGFGVLSVVVMILPDQMQSIASQS